MSEPIKYPEILWSKRALPASVDAYFDAHRGEFALALVRSKYPYAGSPWKKIRHCPEPDPYSGYHYFEGRGEEVWEPIRDKIRNSLTADLLAAAELLSGKPFSSGAHGPAGGFGIDTGEVWVAFLDGGVGVEVHIGQDEYTNSPEGWQHTTIRGPLVFRCLMELLGFDWISETLKGEETIPARADVRRLINENIASQK